MSIHDAEPNDIYVDADGKLWRIIGICAEPSVIAEEIEPEMRGNPGRKSGGVSGLMWNGFKRIYRHVQRASV